MSENARDETPEDPPRDKAAEGSKREREERPQVARQASADPRPQEFGDLIVEQWQAPKIDKMKGDGREIWQFESEKVKPSWTLWFNLFAVILALAGGLALIVYGIWRLASAIGPSGPELP